jgi:hypothetical protein
MQDQTSTQPPPERSPERPPERTPKRPPKRHRKYTKIDWTRIIQAALGCITVVVICVTAMNKGYRITTKVDGTRMRLEFNLRHELVHE